MNAIGASAQRALTNALSELGLRVADDARQMFLFGELWQHHCRGVLSRFAEREC